VKSTEKKAFLMVILGTAYQEARRMAIENINNQIPPECPEYVMRQAFASRELIAKLAELDGIAVDDEEQALERLATEGFAEVIVQPFHIEASDDYERVRGVAQFYAERNAFDKITVAACLNVWVKPVNRAIN
jgi:sirohydrochlorin cobaltochelatase